MVELDEQLIQYSTDYVKLQEIMAQKTEVEENYLINMNVGNI